jgi:hypothetical protein
VTHGVRSKIRDQLRTIGSNAGRLSSTDRDFDPITGIPMTCAISVNIRPAAQVP